MEKDKVALSDYQYLWDRFKHAIDEVDKLRADYKALENACEAAGIANDELASALKEVTAELAECMKDARRYEWLRKENGLPLSAGHEFAVIIDDEDGGTWVGSDLDHAIDNAIARSE